MFESMGVCQEVTGWDTLVSSRPWLHVRVAASERLPLSEVPSALKPVSEPVGLGRNPVP